MEAGPNPFAALLERGERQSVAKLIIADTFANGLQQKQLQPTAMDRILRPLVSGRHSPWLAVYQLSEFVIEVQSLRRDAGLSECFAETQLDEFTHRGGLKIDADAERRELARRLIESDPNA